MGNPSSATLSEIDVCQRAAVYARILIWIRGIRVIALSALAILCYRLCAVIPNSLSYILEHRWDLLPALWADSGTWPVLTIFLVSMFAAWVLQRLSRTGAVTIVALAVLYLMPRAIALTRAAFTVSGHVETALTAWGAVSQLWLLFTCLSLLILVCRLDDASRHILAAPINSRTLSRRIGFILGVPDIAVFAQFGRISALLLLSVATLLETVAPILIFRSLSSPSDEWPNIIVIPYLVMLAYLLDLASGRIRRAARALVVDSADDALRTDLRPPVLFLRAFMDEQVSFAGAPPPSPLHQVAPGGEYLNLEELLVDQFWFVGPVVAVADPMKLDPPVGAARWRVSDTEWMEFVRDKIAAANIIIVTMAASTGLRWELDTLRKSGALSKTVFVLAPENTRDSRLIATLADVLANGWKAKNNNDDKDWQKYVMAIVCVDENQPVFFVTSTLTQLDYYVALRNAIAMIPLGPLSGIKHQNEEQHTKITRHSI